MNAQQNRITLRGLVLLLFITIPACSSSRVYIAPDRSASIDQIPPSDDQIAYEVYLIGDAGGATEIGSEPALTLLKEMTASADSNGVVVFLGDNIYCCGLPDSSDAYRRIAEMRLMEQVNAVRDYSGRVVFIPGNHDWSPAELPGTNRLARQEALVEELFGGANVFLPDDGLPGPIEVKLKDGLSLVVIDTEWWMRDDPKPYGESGSVDIKEEGDFILGLQNLISRRRNDDLIVVGHHPIKSNGRHGGHFSLKDHLFPLTAVFHNAYIPLPVIGSLYPLLRRAVGGPQDFNHPKYRSLRRALSAVFGVHEGRLVYAAGHEHNLQYFADKTTFHVISGAGSRPSYVSAGHDARFTFEGEGLIRIRYYDSGEMWLEAWGITDNAPRGTMLYRTMMDGPVQEDLSPSMDPTEQSPIHVNPDSTITIAVDPSLEAGSLTRFFLGDHHRTAWTTPVTAPVLDIGTAYGGLTPVKRGGGLQTTSIRMVNPDGHEYVLRSITKDPTKTIPPNLIGTVAADVVKDQIAILHPYGALIVPRLAEAAGIYHTNPTLVYVPSDPRFGPFQDLVADQLMLLEERPDDDMSDFPSFGMSKKVVGVAKMIREVTADNDHRVDEAFFARSRLFDMFISDWDRHADQWRWATFPSPDGKGRTYRAIPRDRDWAFNRMNGLFPSLVKSRMIMPKFQDFTENYGYILGLNENGLVQDRRFTSSLSRNDWRVIAAQLVDSITDAVIDSALSVWPDEIRTLYETGYRRLLRIRRDHLQEVADEYYDILAQESDVVGSDKHERFEVRRIDDDRVEVVVHKTSKEGEIRKELFRRIYWRSETREIRLYGLGGNDVFVVTGAVDHSIRIFAIGGTGFDRFVDQSMVRSSGNYFSIYDIPGGTHIETGPNTRLRTSQDPLVNEYDPHEYSFNLTVPSLFFGRNQDDGYFFGGGATFTNGGFRQHPFSSRHTVLANIAARTGAFNLVYSGRFTKQFGAWDFGIDFSAATPNNIRNFYGLGNKSENTAEESEFYQARMSQVDLGLSIIKQLGDFGEFYLGPTVEFADIRRDDDRFVGLPQAGIAPSSFDDQWYAGLEFGVIVDARDSGVFPTQGFVWENRLHARFGLDRLSTNFTRMSSDFVFYLTPENQRRHTLAIRLGAFHNVGSFPFYLASTVGGAYNLRGWRSTRFAGRTALFQNVELRSRLLTFSTLLAAGSAGSLIFVDNGRVYTDGENSGLWHQGYGLGFWINFFDLSVFTGTFGNSTEEATVTLKLGFFY